MRREGEERERQRQREERKTQREERVRRESDLKYVSSYNNPWNTCLQTYRQVLSLSCLRSLESYTIML